MNWSISTPVVQNVVEPQTVAVNITQGINQILVLLLASRDARDNFYNTATFNGQAMTTFGHQVRDDGGSDIATIHGLYFNCATLNPGSYDLVKEVTTGGPANGIEAWFVITGNDSQTPVHNTSGNKGASTLITDSINAYYDDMLVLSACGSEPDSLPSTGAGQTDIVSTYNGAIFLGCSYKNLGNQITQMYWNQTNDRWAQITMTIRKGVTGGAFLLNFV